MDKVFEFHESASNHVGVEFFGQLLALDHDPPRSLSNIPSHIESLNDRYWTSVEQKYMCSTQNVIFLNGKSSREADKQLNTSALPAEIDCEKTNISPESAFESDYPRLVKELCFRKVITCLEKEGKKYVLLEIMHLLFFSAYELWQLSFAVETMCNLTVSILSREEELMFIARYKLPTKRLRLPKVIELQNVCDNLNNVLSALEIMFRAEDNEPDSTLDAFLDDRYLLNGVSRIPTDPEKPKVVRRYSSYRTTANLSQGRHTKRRPKKLRRANVAKIESSQDTVASVSNPVSLRSNKGLQWSRLVITDFALICCKRVPCIKRYDEDVTLIEILRCCFFSDWPLDAFLSCLIQFHVVITNIEAAERDALLELELNALHRQFSGSISCSEFNGKFKMFDDCYRSNRMEV